MGQADDMQKQIDWLKLCDYRGDVIIPVAMMTPGASFHDLMGVKRV